MTFLYEKESEEFESTVVIKCGWEIRLTIITCLGGKNARD